MIYKHSRYLSLTLLCLASPATAQIFIANGFNTDAYNPDGSLLTSSLICL